MARLVANIPDDVIEAILTGNMDDGKLSVLRQCVKRGVQLSDDVMLLIQSGNSEISVTGSNPVNDDETYKFDDIVLERYIPDP